MELSSPHPQIVHFSTWAGALETVDSHLARIGQVPIAQFVARDASANVARMAALDRDWHAETSRCLAHAFAIHATRVVGPGGIPQLLQKQIAAAVPHWLIFEGHTPGKLTGLLAKVLGPLTQRGWRIAWYAFDEASRRLPAFREAAPYLSLLIHDEAPLDPASAALLASSCRTVHRSWVANLVPYAAPFVEGPEDKILFLGSKLGLTPHRQRQIDFLRKRFGQRFVAIHDHSVSVSDRLSLGRFKVSVCPEGRMFATPAMGATHTDRPFWSGCLGMVPVSEDSKAGGRLNELHEQNLILRYAHGDLDGLARACERALELSFDERRRIYDYYNQHETVGTVLAQHLEQAQIRPQAA